MHTQWREALEQLEREATSHGASISECKVLANVIRDDVEAIEKTLGKAAKRGSDVIDVLQESGNTKKRAREVLVWMRGSSLSFRFDDYDEDFFSEFWTEVRAKKVTLRFRPTKPDEKTERESFALGQGVRATVAVVSPQEPPAVGDWVARDCAARNAGGHSGRTNTLTFGIRDLGRVEEETDEDDDDEEIGPEPEPDAPPHP